MSYQPEESTRLYRDIDEELRQKIIVPLLEKSSLFMIQKDYKSAYYTLREIFYRIQLYTFLYKDELGEMTNQIDIHIDNAGSTFNDMGAMIRYNENEIQFKELVKMYNMYIPHALSDLGLYFRIIKSNNDVDEIFNEKTFTLKRSLIKDKIESIKKLSVNDIIKHLTPEQISDVYCRSEIDDVRSNKNLERS